MDYSNIYSRYIQIFCQSYQYKGFNYCLDGMKRQALEEFKEIYPLSQVEDNKRRFQKNSIEGTKPEDYSERIIPIGKNKNILAGIRHAEGDTNIPFLSIWPDYLISNKNDLKDILTKVKPLYHMFCPKYLQFWVCPNSDLFKLIENIGIPRRVIYAGSISDILSSNQTTKLPVGFEITNNLGSNYWNSYLEIYKDNNLENVQYSDSFQPNSKEEIDESHENGLLWGIRYEKDIIGMIQGDFEEIFGYSGLYISDKIIKRKYRGKNLASLGILEILRSLESSYRFIHGEIQFKNIASIKSAIHMGRSLVRSEFLIPLDDLK